MHNLLCHSAHSSDFLTISLLESDFLRGGVLTRRLTGSKFIALRVYIKKLERFHISN